MKARFGLALAAALLGAPTSLVLTGCAKSAPDSVLLPAVQETPSPASPAFAQAMRQGMPFAMLLQHRAELGLTDAQVTRLEAIRERLQQQNQPLLAQLREAGVMPRPAPMRPGMRMQQMTPEQREEMRARMQERMQQLTPEQREQMQARMQEMRTRMQQLTPEQREQMRAQRQQQRQQRMQELSPEQREQMRARMQERRPQAMARARAAGERRIPEELRPIVQQIQENNRAAMQEARSVLTPQQQERMRELMQERRREAMERRGRR